MSQALVDQFVLWILTAAISALGIIILAIGRHIIGKVEATSFQVASLRQENNDKFASLQREMADDFVAVRERLSRVEGAVFKDRRDASHSD